MGPIEIVATVFGVLCVVLTIRQNILCWPAGLVQVLLYIWIFWQVRLYSDLLLHVVYVGLSVYGWIHWGRGGRDRDELPVTRLKPAAFATWGALALVGTVGWGALMAGYTDAALPYPDAFTTVASLIAQWLMARKRLESWLFWISVDLVAIPVYLVKGLHYTTGLYTIFLVLATLGLLEWRRKAAAPAPALAPAPAGRAE